MEPKALVAELTCRCKWMRVLLVPGNGFGIRPSVWMKNAGRSYLPCPSSLHGRGPSLGT